MLRIQRLRVMTAIASGLVLTGLTVAAQSDLVTYHDLGVMPWGERGKMKIKAVLGRTGSLAVAEFPEGLRGTPHHHQQEQVVLGLHGSTETSVDGTVHRVRPLSAVVTHANVEHFSMNGGTGVAAFIEFQPVVRADWVPPYSPFSSMKSAAPVAAGANDRIFADFKAESSEWIAQSDGARSKSVRGKTIKLTVWDLSAPKATVTVNSRGEMFAYVLEGHAMMRVETNEREIKPQTVAVVSPAAKHVRLSSMGKGRTLIALFEAEGP